MSLMMNMMRMKINIMMKPEDKDYMNRMMEMHSMRVMIQTMNMILINEEDFKFEN